MGLIFWVDSVFSFFFFSFFAFSWFFGQVKHQKAGGSEKGKFRCSRDCLWLGKKVVGEERREKGRVWWMALLS